MRNFNREWSADVTLWTIISFADVFSQSIHLQLNKIVIKTLNSLRITVLSSHLQRSCSGLCGKDALSKMQYMKQKALILF